MAGTSEGNRKGAITKRKLYGDEFFAEMAKKSNKEPNRPKGFAKNPKLAKEAGAKGLRIRYEK